MQLVKNHECPNGEMAVKLVDENLELVLERMKSQVRLAIEGNILFPTDVLNIIYSTKLFDLDLVEIPYIQRDTSGRKSN